MFSIFMVEMGIILMNLIIGVDISNIQEMRQNADGHRLAREVLLQCYLETLLQVTSVQVFSVKDNLFLQLMMP